MAGSHGSFYNFPQGMNVRTASAASVASLASTGARYNYPPGFNREGSRGSMRGMASPRGMNRGASRASMASIAEKAESAGSQEDFLEEDFAAHAVVCYKTPEATPTSSKDGPFVQPHPTACV